MTSSRRWKVSDTGFHDYVVHDLLSGVSGVTSRSMFSGWGIYKDGLIFAIIVEGELFFKANHTTRAFFEARGSRPFTYTTRARPTPVAMPYWRVPDEVMEDQELFHEWVARAVRVATCNVTP